MKNNPLNSCRLAIAISGLTGTAAFAHTPPTVVVDDPQAQVHAADPQTVAETSQIQDIVVTAQRRSESLQKTALTIQVIQPRALENAGITSPTQLTNLIPSLQIGNSGPSTSVYLRGVGGYSSTAGQSPAIPYYIDGVYVARSQSVVSEFYDVDRLEVLKGPQGTLYGRNASGGAINIISRRPVLGKVEGRAALEIGNYGNQNGEAAINIPFSDTIALRASTQIVDKGGYSSEGLGDDVHQSVRLKALWEPSSDVSLLLNGSYGHIGGLGQPWVVLNRNIPGWNPWLDSSSPQGRAFNLATAIVPVPGAVRPARTEEARQNLYFWNASAELNLNLGAAQLTIVPAYRYANMQYTSLFSSLYSNGYGLGDEGARPETSKATSLEVRLSHDSKVLKWVAGLYYYNEDQFQQFTVNPGFTADTGNDANYGTRSYAAFGQTTLAITDTIRLIGGLRYTSDRRSISNGISYVISPQLSLAPPAPALVPCAFPNPTAVKCVADRFAGSKTYHNLSWKGGFEADVLGDSLLYATVSRGFKAGGYNTQSIVGSNGSAIPFAPETLTSYEVGLKNRLLNNRVQLNLSGFYWDYKNHQEPFLAFTNLGTINLIYNNAGSTEIYGGTVDVIARPWTGGTLTTSVEYAHSRYKNFLYDTPAFTFTPGASGCTGRPSTAPGFVTIDCSGLEAVKTPKVTASASFTQDIPLATGKLVPTIGATYAASRWLGVEFTRIERAKAYALIDASLTYQPDGQRWSVTAFARNINNGRAYTQAIINPASAIVTANIGSRRTYGARASFNF